MGRGSIGQSGVQTAKPVRRDASRAPCEFGLGSGRGPPGDRASRTTPMIVDLQVRMPPNESGSVGTSGPPGGRCAGGRRRAGQAGLPRFADSVFLAAMLVTAADVVVDTTRQLLRGRLDVDLLMLLAAGGAALGGFGEGDPPLPPAARSRPRGSGPATGSGGDRDTGSTHPETAWRIGSDGRRPPSRWRTLSPEIGSGTGRSGSRSTARWTRASQRRPESHHRGERASADRGRRRGLRRNAESRLDLELVASARRPRR